MTAATATSTKMDTLDGRFQATAARQPGAVAVRAGDASLTYAELDSASDRLVSRLQAAGVPRGSLVAIRLHRGLALPVALLGVLKHGCGYLPIDPGYPGDRQRQVLDDARVRYIVALDDPLGAEPEVVERPEEHLPWDLPADVAYVIYTSGSTGRPKGVVVGHKHVLALFESAEPLFGLGPDDVVTQFHSHCFDYSVWEIWAALLYGGTVLAVPNDLAQDPAAFAEFLAAEGVTILSQVPTVFGYLLREMEDAPRLLPALRYLLLGGEPVDLPAVARWRSLGCAPQSRVVNLYGPTETTVLVTFRELTEADRAGPGATPLGLPLEHVEARVVDEDLRRVPDGAQGELLLAGPSVTYGYLGRPDLTADRFISLPDAPGRWYRTGDWVIRSREGELVYIGRRDDQVKIRGFRIELGEIEAVLREHPDVSACAVTVSKNRLGEQLLVAHYVARRPGTDLASALRDHCRSKLPRPLVPVRYQPHDRLPLTVGGKLDRRALTARP